MFTSRDEKMLAETCNMFRWNWMRCLDKQKKDWFDDKERRTDYSGFHEMKIVKEGGSRDSARVSRDGQCQQRVYCSALISMPVFFIPRESHLSFAPYRFWVRYRGELRPIPSRWSLGQDNNAICKCINAAGAAIVGKQPLIVGPADERMNENRAAAMLFRKKRRRAIDKRASWFSVRAERATLTHSR